MNFFTVYPFLYYITQRFRLQRRKFKTGTEYIIVITKNIDVNNAYPKFIKN